VDQPSGEVITEVLRRQTQCYGARYEKADGLTAENLEAVIVGGPEEPKLHLGSPFATERGVPQHELAHRMRSPEGERGRGRQLGTP
jgi:hypothetical protein